MGDGANQVLFTLIVSSLLYLAYSLASIIGAWINGMRKELTSLVEHDGRKRVRRMFNLDDEKAGKRHIQKSVNAKRAKSKRKVKVKSRV